jgi:NodT family efflux transporter outer membrane factor (OMF) lipoprotein
MIRSSAISVLSCVMLTSCTVGPSYTTPALSTPAGWVEPPGGAPAPDGAWWRSFGDAELESLVGRAARANTNVRIAVARLREARARRGVVSAALFPHVDLDASYSNSRFSENGFLQGFGPPSGGSGSLPGAIVPGQQINLYQVGLDASWEIDIFGGQRRAVEAAEADLAAAEYDTGDVVRSVLAEVADGYVQYRGLQTRLALARDTAASDQRSLDVVAEQAKAGIASDFDLSRAEAQTATSRAAVPALDSALRVAVRRLEVLLGAMPGALDLELGPVGPIPAGPDAMAAGIPSETLRRRPDIRAAERRLASATARIGVATADLLPRFSLTGSFGLQSQKIEDLPKGDSRFWAIGPAVRWPLLDFGRIRSNIAVENARTLAAEAAYEGAVLQGLSDVEVALVQLARERQRGVELDRAAAAADRSQTIAQDLYRNGVLEYTSLLDAQRTRNSARDAAAQSHAAASSATIALFKALGGGWTEIVPTLDEGAPRSAVAAPQPP